MKTKLILEGTDQELQQLSCPQCGNRLAITSHSQSVRLAKGARGIAKSDLPVMLINGKGSDKQRFARMIHDNSFRCNGPFQVLDCANKSAQEQEIALFGGCGEDYVKNQELMQKADGGTLFIDNVERLALSVQTKLYRFMQTESYTAAQSWRVRYAHVRVIVAGSIDLHKAVIQGTFLHDLCNRLTTASIRVPSLWPSAPLPLQVN